MPRSGTLLLASLTLALAVFAFSHPMLNLLPGVRAASFTLFGRIINPAGWGPTISTEVSPGPTLFVNPGESVTILLASGDGFAHNWGVDYNGNRVCNAGEPCSQNFMTTQITFTFTATTIPGNYTYFCFIHFEPMIGSFIVRQPHDVAVSGLTVSRNFAYNSITSNPVQVNVTAQNPGTNTETFAVYAKANTTLIGNSTVTVGAGMSMVVSFNWNPKLLARGNYVLTANATRVMGETVFTNNQLAGGIFTVRFKGDVNGDCKVDIVDLALVGGTFGKTSTSAGFNPSADLNNDGKTDIVDLVLVAGNFGQAC